MKVVMMSDGSRTFAVCGLFKRHLSPQDYNVYKFLGVQDLGRQDAWLAAVTEVPRGMVAGA